MPQERPDGSDAPGAGDVKVTDRRRFRPDGEPIDPGGPGEPAPAQPGDASAEVAGELARRDARIDELTRAYAALVEDNKGFRARQERERVRVVEAERAHVAQALLEATDDLERALAAVSGAGEASGAALQNLVQGVRLSLSALHKRVADLGAERIPVVGQPFDPHVAEAVDTVAVAEESRDGVVVQEVRPGYRIAGRVLRPARVRVGRLARA